MESKFGEIITVFLSVLNQIKIYHWQTQKYARHIASDTLFQNLSLNVDKFVEILLQKSGNKRFTVPNDRFVYNDQNDDDIIDLLKTFKNFLIKLLPKDISKQDSDLINIRDEMLANINQTLYLFTLE